MLGVGTDLLPRAAGDASPVDPAQPEDVRPPQRANTCLRLPCARPFCRHRRQRFLWDMGLVTIGWFALSDSNLALELPRDLSPPIAASVPAADMGHQFQFGRAANDVLNHQANAALDRLL